MENVFKKRGSPKPKQALLIGIALIAIASALILFSAHPGQDQAEPLTEQMAKEGDLVKINYIGRFADGVIFDTSYEEVGKGVGLSRDSYGPLKFVVGSGQVIKGLDEAVIGMVVGEEKNITVPPEKAFGPRDEELILVAPLGALGNDVKPGTLITIEGKIARIVKVENETVTLDFNHPLAGQTLLFTLKLEYINSTYSFTLATDNTTVTLKYFWSAYCGYCKVQDPILYDFLQEHPTLNLVIIDVNKEESIDEMVRYNAFGTPTFVLIKGDTELITGGLLSKEQLTEFICPKLQDEMCLTGEATERGEVTRWW